MKRLIPISIILATTVTLWGCSTTPASKVAAPAPVSVEECYFPMTDVKAPGWVCDQPVSGWSVTAPGSAEKTAAGIAFQKQMALTDARVQLAQQVKVHVTNMVKQFAETTGAGDSESVDKVNTSVTKQITDQMLSGSKPVASVVGPDGRYWVLVGIDAKGVEEITKVAVQTSMNNERALWQKFQAKKSQDELAEEIAKQQVVDSPMPLTAPLAH